MACEIKWDGLSKGDWDARFVAVRRSTLLQSPAYARSVCRKNGQVARQALISIDGREAGLVQIQEASLLGRCLHALVLDRGPLWFDGFGKASDNRCFFKRLAEEFPARFGRKRRIIAEMPARYAPEVFADLDLQPVPGQPGYQTIWIDLRDQPDILRRRLRPKWRNMLNKAERQDLTVEWDWSGASLPVFLAHYAADQDAKGYGGASPETLRDIAKAFTTTGDAGIAIAYQNDAVAAGALVLCHGQSATYQAGWVTPLGRKSAANHLLLWDALLTLKGRGTADLDLGGVNERDAIGVRRFKDGLGGHSVGLPAQHR